MGWCEEYYTNMVHIQGWELQSSAAHFFRNFAVLESALYTAPWVDMLSSSMTSSLTLLKQSRTKKIGNIYACAWQGWQHHMKRVTTCIFKGRRTLLLKSHRTCSETSTQYLPTSRTVFCFSFCEETNRFIARECLLARNAPPCVGPLQQKVHMTL